MNELILSPPSNKADRPFKPYLPETAPFSEEQRAWLNGFLAGLFSSAPENSAKETAPQARALQPLTILFGTQTGNAETLAKRAAKFSAGRGFSPQVRDLAQCDLSLLSREQNVLVIISTYGDGEPPDSARNFWEALQRDEAPELAGVRFSVCGLGDTNYPKFCQCGKEFDRRLEELQAQRVFPRVDCDVDYEEKFEPWMQGALQGFTDMDTPASQGSTALRVELDRRELSEAQSALMKCSRQNPVPARLLKNRLLSGTGSGKEIRHFEFSLEHSGLAYECGDALGICPENCPELVDEIIRALGCGAEVCVPLPGGGEAPLREALLRHYDICRIDRALLEYVAARADDPELKKLISPEVNGELDKFLWGRQVIDLLLACPGCGIAPADFVRMLKKLQPRLYSISSSPLACPDQVHLTVGVVRYETLGRKRKGICSAFLADRIPEGGATRVFPHSNKNFRLPLDASRSVIMVGPGTGIAPFRAFLQERAARGGAGKNWLFFGDQHAGTDFLYRDEIEAFLRKGILARLDTAFSRDQPDKIYAQHRMRENALELYAWLEEGAHFYVCGDAARMARDVDAALHEVIQCAAGCSAEEAAEYVRKMKQEKRYQRDVY